MVGMLFAGVYAVGEFSKRLPLSIPEMVLVHGITDGFGFGLCGLVGWTLIQ